MLIRTDCIPCILKMSISLIRSLSLDEDKVKELYCEILDIPSLRGHAWDITSPEIIEIVMAKIMRATGSPDPFSSEKSEQNKMIMELYPFLKDLANGDSDPVHTGVKLAILGNSIDFMMDEDARKIENSITEKLRTFSLSKEAYLKFKEQLGASRLVLYFADNSGEIVFDRIFIEIIKKLYDLEIIFVVRSIPTLNDATLKEANSVGIGKIAEIVENGIDGPLPGTILNRCSSEVNDLVPRADLIISKGGGNFDTLEGQREDLKNNITFMLLSKCYPLFKYFGTELYQPVLANFFK